MRRFSAEEIRDLVVREVPPAGISLARTPLPTKTTWEDRTVEVDRVVKTACSRNCYDTCGILAYVKDGRLLKVEGDPDHPINRGTLCVKGYTYPQRVHSPDRVRHPLLRTGERGEGRFRRVSWEEAFDWICERLHALRERWGSEAFMEYLYSGNREFLAKQVSGRFLALFGASKLVGSF